MGQLAGAVQVLAADRTSLLARHLGGDGYTLSEHLLMLVVDELRLANWQRSKDGSKGRRKPKPISPLAQKDTSTSYGDTEGRDPAEVAALLDRYGPSS